MKKGKLQKNRGMTYVELIVVLSIFSVMTAIALFNHSAFQAKVDVKNLAHDIALRVVEAQTLATSGRLAPSGQQPTVSNWRPAYGAHFNLSSPGNNKAFITYVDRDQNGDFTDSLFCSAAGSGECLSKTSILRGSYISSIAIESTQSGNPSSNVNNLSITFTRPDSKAVIKTSGVPLATTYYAKINLSTPSGLSSSVSIFPSGRVQIN